MNIDYKKCRTTIHEKFMDNDSPIVADFVWGESKRVLFCKSMTEMDTKVKELGWYNSSYDRVKITFEKDSVLPLRILSNLELSNWRNDETVALVKLNEKSMVLHIRCRGLNLSDEEIQSTIKDAKEADERFEHQHWHETKEEWIWHNYLYKGNIHTYTGSIHKNKVWNISIAK